MHKAERTCTSVYAVQRVAMKLARAACMNWPLRKPPRVRSDRRDFRTAKHRPHTRVDHAQKDVAPYFQSVLLVGSDDPFTRRRDDLTAGRIASRVDGEVSFCGMGLSASVAAVFSLREFGLAGWFSLSIGGWQPSGAAIPARWRCHKFFMRIDRAPMNVFFGRNMGVLWRHQRQDIEIMVGAVGIEPTTSPV
jgi:hypothetical protein